MDTYRVSQTKLWFVLEARSTQKVEIAGASLENDVNKWASAHPVVCILGIKQS